MFFKQAVMARGNSGHDYFKAGSGFLPQYRNYIISASAINAVT
jgi:hypothetical protein